MLTNKKDLIKEQKHNFQKRAVGVEFQVNSYTTGPQESPAIASLASGDFVVVWETFGQEDGTSDGIYGQRYSSSGVAQGAEFQINSYTTGDQIHPVLTSLPSGDFVVVWESLGQDGDGYGVYGQRYTSVGVAQGSEFQVNSYTTSHQQEPAISSLSSGDFVGVWHSDGQDGSFYGIYGQRYSSTGVDQGIEFRVNSYTTNYQVNPAIASLASGGFVVVWRSLNQDGSFDGVYGQRYSNSSIAQDAEFQINSYTTYNQLRPAVSTLPTGDFVVVWSSDGQDGNLYGVYAQRYSAVGVTQGGEFLVNSHTTGNQGDNGYHSSAVASLPNGDFVVTWESDSQDGNSQGVYAHIFPNTTSLTTTGLSSTVSSSVTSGISSSLTSSVSTSLSSAASLSLTSGIVSSDSMTLSSSSTTTTTAATSSSAPNTETPDNPSPNFWFIPIAIASGAVGLSILLTVIGLIKRQRKQEKEKRENDKHLDSSTPDIELAEKPNSVYQPIAVTTHNTIDLGYKILEPKNSSVTDLGYKQLPTVRPHSQTALSMLKKNLLIESDEVNQEKQIGQGAFGFVYKGTWNQIEVAIKRLQIFTTDAVKKELLAEAELVAKINSPYTVQLYGVIIEQQGYAMVMEYCSGGSLDNFLMRGNSIEWSVRYQISYDVAKGLKDLHQQNVIHRDIKSGNVLLTENHHAKISDFGISREREGTKAATVGDKVLGSIAWMGPELFADQPKYSTKSDIYSYGVLLWEIASRQKPRGGPQVGVLRLQGKREEIPQDTPIQFAELIKYCWMQEKDDRPDAEEVIQEMDAIMKMTK